MMQQIQAQKTPNFEQKILAELAAIKQRLDERNTLEKFFQSGLLTPLRLSPQSRKIYVAESQLNQIFKSQVDQNR